MRIGTQEVTRRDLALDKSFSLVCAVNSAIDVERIDARYGLFAHTIAEYPIEALSLVEQGRAFKAWARHKGMTEREILSLLPVVNQVCTETAEESEGIEPVKVEDWRSFLRLPLSSSGSKSPDAGPGTPSAG